MIILTREIMGEQMKVLIVIEFDFKGQCCPFPLIINLDMPHFQSRFLCRLEIYITLSQVIFP
jgi:hypothetical protein